MSLLERLERLERIKRNRDQDVTFTDEEEEREIDDNVRPAAKQRDETVLRSDDSSDAPVPEHQIRNGSNSVPSTDSKFGANQGEKAEEGERVGRRAGEASLPTSPLANPPSPPTLTGFQSDSFSQQLFKRVSNKRSRDTQTDGEKAKAKPTLSPTDSEIPKAQAKPELPHTSNTPIEDVTENGTPTKDPIDDASYKPEKPSSPSSQQEGAHLRERVIERHREETRNPSPEEQPVSSEGEQFEERTAVEEETAEQDTMRANQRSTGDESDLSTGRTVRSEERGGSPDVPSDFYADLKLKLHSKLLDSIPPQLLGGSYSDEQVRAEVERLVNNIISEEPLPVSRAEREQLFTEVMDEITGLGPIQEFMRDKEVTEIMVNGPKQIYIECNGKLELTNRVFKDAEHLMRIIQRIIAPINRRVDESTPMVDARLPDGSRVNAVIPSVSLIGPVLNIHKFYKDIFTVEDLLEFGSLTQEMADFLAACVLARMDIMVSGGTSTGKTTLLNTLSSFIPEVERLITIEDAAELKLHQQHIITLESRPANIAGSGEITIRDIVRNALRMRPDRIIIGEVRGGETLDMLQAMNTGHEGSMSTCHANSPYDMISRLETMVMMAGMNLPEKAIREQIASAIDIIVHMSRLHDGSRKVIKITEVQGLDNDKIILEDIFSFERKGISEDGEVLGEFKYTGVRPKFLEELKIAGIQWQGDGQEDN